MSERNERDEKGCGGVGGLDRDLTYRCVAQHNRKLVMKSSLPCLQAK